jgi:hypothetical protein
LATPFVHDGIEQHYQHAENREHDLWQDADVIYALGEAGHSLEEKRHRTTSLLAN